MARPAPLLRPAAPKELPATPCSDADAWQQTRGVLADFACLRTMELIGLPARRGVIWRSARQRVLRRGRSVKPMTPARTGCKRNGETVRAGLSFYSLEPVYDPLRVVERYTVSTASKCSCTTCTFRFLSYFRLSSRDRKLILRTPPSPTASARHSSNAPHRARAAHWPPLARPPRFAL